MQGGVVINNAPSGGTRVFVPSGALSGATKAAVVSLTRASVIGLAPQRITAFAICPWIVDTPMLGPTRRRHGNSGKLEIAARLAPRGRMTTPGEVASVVRDLCSDAPSLHTGDVLLIDAGGTTEVLLA